MFNTSASDVNCSRTVLVAVIGFSAFFSSFLSAFLSVEGAVSVAFSLSAASVFSVVAVSAALSSFLDASAANFATSSSLKVGFSTTAASVVAERAGVVTFVTFSLTLSSFGADATASVLFSVAVSSALAVVWAAPKIKAVPNNTLAAPKWYLRIEKRWLKPYQSKDLFFCLFDLYIMFTSYIFYVSKIYNYIRYIIPCNHLHFNEFEHFLYHLIMEFSFVFKN